MHNITLIFTRHKENGCCNSIELHEIIKSISPEIIFEELSYLNYQKCYIENSLITLETLAIKRYLHSHNIEHIPVDTFALPQSYDDDIDYMYDRIFNNFAIAECHMLRNLLDKQSSLEFQYGFEFLNSNQNNELFSEINSLKEAILTILNNDKLFRINKLEKEVLEKRENEIIDNICNYSKEHQYSQAIQFIGAGHRESIMKKIERFNSPEKLKWIFYSV